MVFQQGGSGGGAFQLGQPPLHGAALGLGEDAARKRVERALEKLREHFVRRGVSTSAAILTAAISANSVQAAPVGLAARITGPALAAAGRYLIIKSFFT